jgi:hypothetical protein
MSQRMKQGRLPLGLPRVSSPRSSSAYAAFQRPAARRPQRGDTSSDGHQGTEPECSAQITTLPMEPQ